MKKRKKLFVAIALSALAVLFIPAAAAVTRQFSDAEIERYGSIIAPPKANGEKPEKVILDPYAVTGEKLFDDYEKDFRLGYLDNFKAEIVTGSETAAEAERINRKNALIAEYVEYVDDLYMKVMPIEEYEVHKEKLTSIFLELLTLEPEKTPEELFEIDLKNLLSNLKEELYDVQVYGVEHTFTNVEVLKQAITEVTNLQKRYDSRQLNFEQAQQEYLTCLEEKVKTGCPRLYAKYAKSSEDE